MTQMVGQMDRRPNDMMQLALALVLNKKQDACMHLLDLTVASDLSPLTLIWLWRSFNSIALLRSSTESCTEQWGHHSCRRLFNICCFIWFAGSYMFLLKSSLSHHHLDTHTNSSDSGRDENMTCGGGVSIYYSAQSTYIIPLLLDTDSGRSHGFFFCFFSQWFLCGHVQTRTSNF